MHSRGTRGGLRPSRRALFDNSYWYLARRGEECLLLRPAHNFSPSPVRNCATNSDFDPSAHSLALRVRRVLRRARLELVLVRHLRPARRLLLDRRDPWQLRIKHPAANAAAVGGVRLVPRNVDLAGRIDEGVKLARHELLLVGDDRIVALDDHKHLVVLPVGERDAQVGGHCDHDHRADRILEDLWRLDDNKSIRRRVAVELVVLPAACRGRHRVTRRHQLLVRHVRQHARDREQARRVVLALKPHQRHEAAALPVDAPRVLRVDRGRHARRHAWPRHNARRRSA
mmetsp:Transcript_26082/g.61049  ORF Transcript_26082/g.61049 Transcript_26082/m.61049 type:complete len:285 (-) Transcript_26082:144-998(-)